MGEMALKLLHAYLNWAATASKYWSDYAMIIPADDGSYSFILAEALYVGRRGEEDFDDYSSVENTLGNLYPANLVANIHNTYDTYWEKAQAQSPESVTTSRMPSFFSVLMNETTMQVSGCQKLVLYFKTIDKKYF